MVVPNLLIYFFDLLKGDIMGKIKEHFGKHKTSYVVGGAALVTGVGVGVIIANRTSAVYSKNQIVGVVNWKPKQTIEVFIEALGDPGNIIQDLDTGIIYASQNQAARALGVPPARFSEYFAGKISHIKGHNFEKLGKAHIV